MKASAKIQKGIFAAILSVALSACSSNDGDDSGVLTITGQVVSSGANGATVELVAGSNRLIAVADGNGIYRIEVPATDIRETDFVVLRAFASGRDDIVLVSNLGFFADLQSRAGPDAVLDAGDLIRTNISALSTAEVFAAPSLPYPRPRTVGDGIDPVLVTKLAAALELLINQPTVYPLPEGISTTAQFANNEQARGKFIRELELETPDLLRAEQVRILRDSRFISKVSSVPEWPLLTQRNLASAGSWPSPEVLPRIRFAPGGNGVDEVDRPFSWIATDSRVEAQYQVPVVLSFQDTCVRDGQVRLVTGEQTLAGFEFIQLAPSAAAITQTWRRIYSGCNGQESDEVLGLTVYTRIEEPNLLPAFSDVAGRNFVLPLPRSISESGFGGYDTLRFEAGNRGSSDWFDAAFAWQVAAGALSIDLENGSEVRYRLIGKIDDERSLLLVDTNEADGDMSSSVAVAVERDPAAAFTQETMPGRFFLLRTESEITLSDPRLQGSRLRLEPDGKGVFEADYIDNEGVVREGEEGYPDGTGFVRWSVQDGVLVLNRYRDAQLGVFNCEPGTAECRVFDETEIRLIRETGALQQWVNRYRAYDEAGEPLAFEPATLSRARREAL